MHMYLTFFHLGDGGGGPARHPHTGLELLGKLFTLQTNAYAQFNVLYVILYAIAVQR